MTPAFAVGPAGGAALAVQRALYDDRLGAELAVAEAYLPFVGGAAPQPQAEAARGQGDIRLYVKSAPR